VTHDEIQPIETDRLVLVSMTKDFLRALSENDLDLAQSGADFEISRPCSLAGSPFIGRRLELI